ncbi:hypothetical protein D3C87_1830070 [compost metagenome]
MITGSVFSTSGFLQFIHIVNYGITVTLLSFTLKVTSFVRVNILSTSFKVFDRDILPLKLKFSNDWL